MEISCMLMQNKQFKKQQLIPLRRNLSYWSRDDRVSRLNQWLNIRWAATETRSETDYYDNEPLSSYLKILWLILCFRPLCFTQYCVKSVLHFLCRTQHNKDERTDRGPHTDSSAGQNVWSEFWSCLFAPGKWGYCMQI